MVILVIAALVILGPERLPGAMSWVAKALKQAREYATGAQSQLKEELGPEFEEFKKPFDELRGMRGMTPRGVITKHLLDGDDSLFTGNFDGKPGPRQSNPAQNHSAQNSSAQGPAAALPPAPHPPGQNPAGQSPAGQSPDGPGGAPPPRYDLEAT